jgi:hypothetical protein
MLGSLRGRKRSDLLTNVSVLHRFTVHLDNSILVPVSREIVQPK